MAESPGARTWAAAGAILIVAVLLRAQGISTQPVLGDEDLVAATAIHYVEGGQLGPTMWYHPVLRNLVAWAVCEVFGYGPAALRATSVLLGILSIPLTGLLLVLLTRDRRAALVASFLLAVDQVHVTFSRQAIQETWTTFFILLGSTLAVLAWRRNAAWPVALSGIAFGLGVSSKLHAVLPLAVFGVAGLVLAWRERSPEKAAWVVACLAALPAIVFLATYMPWFARGYGVGDWLAMQAVLLSKMATHAGNPMDQVIDTSAWQWFLRPMGYASFVFSGGSAFVTIAFSNPLVWLLVIPASAYVARAALPPHAAAAGERLVLVLFAASYLPLAAASRPIWLLSAVAVLPFAAMLLGLAASRLADAAPRARGALAAYGAVVLLSSLALYPMAIGEGMAYPYLSPIVERFRPAHEQGRVLPR